VTAILAETVFFAYYWLVLLRDFNKLPEQHAPAELEPDAVVRSFLQHMEHVEDFSHYLSAWFLDAPMESIKLDNVKEMYAYAIWYKTL